MSPKLRVLVVEDSLTMRKHLCEILASDPAIEVVAEAQDGKTAIAMCQRHRPDVVTLDMMLPVMSGLAVTEYLMAHLPTPILVVSASTNRGELFKTYEALAAGAVDVLDKPAGDATDAAWAARFLAAVRTVARIRVITHLRGRYGARHLPTPGSTAATGSLAEAAAPPPRGRGHRVVALGASTGGPGAVLHVLRNLPTDFQLPLLLVQHLSAPFATEYAAWLDGQTSHRVAFAQGGESVASLAGCVVMAPPDQHLVVREGRLRLTDDPPRHSCRPSVDALFESLAAEYGSSAAGCLLTGMGRDGATGLLAIRLAGGTTIAQDEASCVVYGMPREAVQMGAAAQVLALRDIAAALSAL